MTNKEALNVIADMCNTLQLYPNSRQGEAMMMAINSLKNGTPSAENKGDLIRQAEDYENEIADLHNRLDIAEYDKERYKEEIAILEAENKEELTNEKAIAFLQDNGWLVEHDRIMTSGMENKGKWIPVSERLPEKFRFVNCTCHSLIDDREDWVVETVYVPQPPNSPYSDWGNIPMLNDKECEVTAWVYREIPEPYKEKE